MSKRQTLWISSSVCYRFRGGDVFCTCLKDLMRIDAVRCLPACGPDWLHATQSQMYKSNLVNQSISNSNVKISHCFAKYLLQY